MVLWLFFAHFSGIWHVCQKGGVHNMGILIRVTKQEPCPICGKPDFCFWRERDKNPDMYNLYCNRSSEAEGAIVTGIDGKDYIAIHQSVNRTIFEAVEQREERSKERITGEKKERTRRTYTVLDYVEPLPHEQLDDIYRCILNELPLYKHHAQYLLKEGWSIDLINKHHICSFPAARINKLPNSLKYVPSREKLAKRVMTKCGRKNLTGVPGAFINEKGNWTFACQSGIFLPVYDENGLIYRLRIRLDYLDLPVNLQEDQEGYFYMDQEERVFVTMSGPYKISDGKRVAIQFKNYEGKYRNFSSYAIDKEAYENGFISNVMNKGCEAGNQILYAMNHDDDQKIFWIIEGEKKALFCNQILHQPFLGKAGVNDFLRLAKSDDGDSALDIMRKLGATTAILADDADRYSNNNVMRCMKGLADLLKNSGFNVFIADWNVDDGKGLDDLLASGRLPALYEYK